ncbi:related to NAR1 - similarity to human nuclear prelamin A recognition factor [Ustilago bromivora]|uniref:Cytosolic Fe-S cluster assembly factor NAR1 n=2 Tax=Ustilago bromivora TaxID=307758 RepID=A0A8H8QQW8_9BASI|nr:related to NAR1 - similarity to human nuclear prelamin A recognition factor [Ustilago bromivora]
MAFSGALTLTDLNDYLGPSQACIKPVEGADAPTDHHTSSSDQIHSAASASTQIAIDRDGSYYESTSASTSAATASGSKPRQRTKLETAQISLNDCLACSGCVTSAESVLITMQSQEELRRAVAEVHSSTRPKLLVASISTQSLASLSAKYTFQQNQQQKTSSPSTSESSSESNQARPSTLPLRVLLHRISYFLKTVFQFDHVYDTTFARHIALKEHEREFFQRRANSHKRAKLNNDAATTSDEPTLPMLASACPGWICYAEKTHGELLPCVSTTKSPQQVAGVIAKRFLPHRLGLQTRPSSSTDDPASSQPNIYHLTVMPCYDKKLEASRPDFYDDITNTKEVDCVLTTGELDKLMLDQGFDLCAPVPGEQETMQQSLADLSLEQALGRGASEPNANTVAILPHFPELLDQPGSSSGGYLFNLMRAVWLDWISQHWDQFPESVRERGVLPKLDVRVIRTADFTEFILRAPAQLTLDVEPETNLSWSILFRGAQCYGFRNLQNLVRKLQKQTGARNTRRAAGRLVDPDGNPVGAGPGRNRAAARARARGRGGMIRRGRGNAAVSKSSPLNPDAPQEAMTATTTTTRLILAQEEEEEERGYDYVEVMACPSGCVNGGGQIRPPTLDATQSSTTNDTLDPEGYSKGGWAAEQTNGTDDLELMLHNKKNPSGQGGNDDDDDDDAEMIDGTKQKEIKGWQGTSKEWVRRVEEAYWQGSSVAHTPVNIAAINKGDTPLSSSNAKSIRTEDHQRLFESLAVLHPPEQKQATEIKAYADLLAELVVQELSHLAAAIPAGSNLDEVALDKARNKLFRTQYRAVQDEAVNGLAVQWSWKPTIITLLFNPQARGTVELQSRNAPSHLPINHTHLSNPLDLAILAEANQFGADVVSGP